jgi:hypothetical protein
MPTPLRTLPRNESEALRRPRRRLAVAETASQRRKDGPIISYAHPRGSSPTGS